MTIFGNSKDEDLYTSNKRVELGDKAKDTVSGFEGIVGSKHIYLNGCVRYALEGADKDGAPIGHVFDEQQIEVIEKKAWKSPEAHVSQPIPEDKPLARTGGPRDASVPGVNRRM